MAFSSVSCLEELPPINSSIDRMDARFWHLDYPLTAIATIIANDPNNLDVHCEFRSNRDLVGLIWTSNDLYGHPLLSYEANLDYTGLKIAFLANPRDPYNFNIDITRGGQFNVYRLFPYAPNSAGTVLSPKVTDFNSQGAGPRVRYNVSEVFPEGLPEIPEGFQIYVLDFDNLSTGFGYDGDKIPPNGITRIFFPLTPNRYGIGENARAASAGDVRYIKDGPKVELVVWKTTTLSEWTFRNVERETVFTKGDLLSVNVTTTGRVMRRPKSSRPYFVYAVDSVDLTIPMESWYWTSNDLLRVKVHNGPLKGIAFIGGKAQAQRLHADTPLGNESYTFSMRSISRTGAGTSLGRRLYPQEPHNMMMTTGFDDTYNTTPWRQIDNTWNLGYRGYFNIYMGMSHYFKASSSFVDGQFVTQIDEDAEEPLNTPTEIWCRDLFSRLHSLDYQIIWSTSYEILNSYMPESWKQRDAFGAPALSGWVPPSSFVIPSKVECLDYLARVIKQGLKILDEEGAESLMFQIGEPWWWDGSYTNGAPCIYDDHTTALYTQETGQPVPTPYYTSYEQPVTPEQRPYLEWLGAKLGDSTNYIRDAVKAEYPESLGTLLFFTPQIMNPASEMLPIINFPIEEWKYPNYDFIQIEDYDWIINGELHLLPLTLEAATDILEYPLSVVHYFVGFVLTEHTPWVWTGMNIATRDAILEEIPHIYVWAYSQVIRDGILYDDSLIGSDSAIQPPLPKFRQLGEEVGGPEVRPIMLCRVGDARMNSSDRNIQFQDQTWYATGRFSKLQPLSEGFLDKTSGWRMSLGGLPIAGIEEEAEKLRTATVSLYVGLFNQQGQFSTPPRLVAGGYVTEVGVVLEETSASIEVTVRSNLAGWDKDTASRYSDEQQQVEHPGDRGFSFISRLSQLDLVWGVR